MNTPIPAEQRNRHAREGLAFVQAALAAHKAGQPAQGGPSTDAIRAACSRLRNGGAPCLCAWNPERVLVPCLTAIGLALSAQEAPPCLL